MSDDNTQTADGYNYEPIRDATLDGLPTVEAAEIAGNLGLTDVAAIKYDSERDKYKVKLEVDGGFTAFGDGQSKYAIKSVVGKGNPETITLWVVEKRV